MSEEPTSLDCRPTIGDDGSDIALASARRRTVLAVLLDADRSLTLPELAIRVARREVAAETVSNRTVQETYLSLHHDHVDALSTAGLVRYNRTDGTVELAISRAELADWLGDAPSTGDAR